MISILLDLGPLVAAAVPAAASAAPYVAAGISALSGAAGIAATGNQNKKSRAFSREMYQQQKADNIAFWDQQNEYNSPQQQMQRLKAAGLNPNMVYDKGGAIQPAGNISTPDVQGAQFRTPDFAQMGDGIVQGYFDTKIKQAQYDNLKAMNTEIQNRAIKTSVDTAHELDKQKGTQVGNAFRIASFFPQLEALQLGNEKTNADIRFTNDENVRKTIMFAPNFREAVQRVVNLETQNINDKETLNLIKQNIKNAELDGTLKSLEAKLMSIGIGKNDPFYVKMVGTFANNILKPAMGTPQFWEGFNKFVPYEFRTGTQAILQGLFSGK